jgi:cytochrome c5
VCIISQSARPDDKDVIRLSFICRGAARTLFTTRPLSEEVAMLGPVVTFKSATAVALLALALPLAVSQAQASTRSGKEVVDTVCAACHATGANGAPRIGDVEAWKDRAAQGLTSLTRHAIQGIRKMPAHGGNPGVSDFEIELAITYMVNQSGGHWAVPIDKAAPPAAERSGEQIVQAQCAKCHATGVDGAPRIGDRSAWIPRLREGLDALVRSATRGHGGMPARGGMADLSDTELRSAIVYMINQGVAPAKGQPAAAAPAARPGGDHQVVEGTEIYLGVISAEALRGENLRPGSQEAVMHGGIPTGEGYYHVNVSLFDSKTNAPIADAQVKATVSDPVMGGETKPLEIMATPNAPSYGNYFRISGMNPHTITVHIRRPGAAREITAKFDFER